MPGIFILLTILISSCSASENKSYTIFINNKSLNVEIADTLESRKSGLMNRKSLPPDSGMLFIFEEEQKLSFWMKNTSIPLSIAYINKAGVIKEIHDMTPFSQRPVYSHFTVLYALEVNQGFFEKNDIKAGDTIQFPDLRD